LFSGYKNRVEKTEYSDSGTWLDFTELIYTSYFEQNDFCVYKSSLDEITILQQFCRKRQICSPLLNVCVHVWKNTERSKFLEASARE